MALGISISGFTRPRLVDIQTEISTVVTQTLGQSINRLPQAVVQQFIGIFASREDAAWQATEDVYNSQYPDTAFGASLDNVGSISGIVRLAAKASVQQAQLLFGTAGTLIPSSQLQVSVIGSPTSVFAPNNDVTLGAGVNAVQTLTVSGAPTAGNFQLSIGNNTTPAIAFNATAGAIQALIRAFPFYTGVTVTGTITGGLTVTFLGDASLQPQPLIVVTNNTLLNGGGAVTLTPLTTQIGVAQATVNMTATQTGPIVAPAGTLTNILTPITGLTSTRNVTDAVVGRNVETDNAYKQRRNQSLQIGGSATVNAIRAKLLNLSGVTNASVFENVNEVADGNGRPPKTFECVVNGALDQDVANLIFANKPAGIKTFGTTTVNVTDSQGQVHPISFSRPTQVPIYVIVNITVNASFPGNGVASIQQDIAAAGNQFGIGGDVVANPTLMASIVSVPGIRTAVIFIGTAPSPSSSNDILMTSSQVPVFDTSRITVNVTGP